MSPFVYPRLPLGIATACISNIRTALMTEGFRAVEALAGVEHPRAAPVATGGRVVSADHIAGVRASVLQAVGEWTQRGQVSRPQAAAFDLAMGRTLHEHLEIVPSDAAHHETWSFLTLVVLPDIAVLRFPDMHVDRLTGGNRNVLRRTWIRQEVLGDLLHSASRPLGEDELVGLFERTALARNRTLIRRLASAVLDYDGATARSDWARELYKRITFSTGPRLLDALAEDELDALIRGNERPATVQRSQETAPATSPVGSRSIGPTTPARPRTDLVWPHAGDQDEGRREGRDTDTASRAKHQ